MSHPSTISCHSQQYRRLMCIHVQVQVYLFSCWWNADYHCWNRSLSVNWRRLGCSSRCAVWSRGAAGCMCEAGANKAFGSCSQREAAARSSLVGVLSICVRCQRERWINPPLHLCWGEEMFCVSCWVWLFKLWKCQGTLNNSGRRCLGLKRKLFLLLLQRKTLFHFLLDFL